MKKSTTLIVLFFGLIFTLSAQVTGVDFLIEYNDVTELYDCKLVIVEGEATTYPQRVQFNTQYTIVAPTGTTLTIDSLHNPKEANQFYDGVVPCVWEFGPIEISPPTQPQNDFHTIFASLSPPSAYNNLKEGDIITLFSVSADLDPCENSIRLFKNGIDPNSLEMPSGGDFSNGFALGGGEQIYAGNQTTQYGSYISPNDSISICRNDCVILVPTINCLDESVKYQWSTGETTETIEVCPTEPTNYSLTVLSLFDNALDVIPVYVDFYLGIIPPDDNVLCAGSSITLESCSEDGLWTQGANNPGATLSSLSGGNVEITFSESASGIYEFIFEYQGIIESIQITINPTLVISLDASSVCVGGTVQATSSVPGGTWVSSDPSVANIYGSSDEIYAISEGMVTFTYTTLEGCVSTTSPLLVTQDIDAVLTGPEVICIGSTTTVSPSTGGYWTSADATIATVTNSGIITGNSAGVAYITFVDGVTGCLSNPIIILVHAPNIELTGPNGICVGETTTLSSETEGTWSSSDPSIATISAFTGVVTGVSPGYATFTFFDNETSCLSMPSETVYVSFIPVVEIQNSEICIGETTQVNSNPEGIWVSDNTSVATVHPTTGLVTAVGSGTVRFSVTNDLGCSSSSIPLELTVYPNPEVEFSGLSAICPMQTTTLTLNSGGIWTSSNVTVASIDNLGNVTGIESGSAMLKFTDLETGCISDPLEIIVIGPSYTPTASNNSPICEYEDLQLTTNSIEGAEYQWYSPSGAFLSNDQNPIITNTTSADQGTYCVVVSINGCESAEGCTIVYFNPFPTTPIANNNGSLCEGEDLELTTDLVAGATYEWTGPNGYTSTVQNPTLSSATPIESGQYCVIVTIDGCESEAGCTGVIINPTPSTPIANNNLICAGEDLALTTDAVAGATYAWSGPNGFTSTDQNPIIPNATASDFGSYCVIVTVDGCASLEGCTDVILSTAIPSAINNGPLCEGDDLVLTTDFVSGATYSWTGPDGFTSSVQSPMIVEAGPASGGTYCVQVTIGGCPSEVGCTEVVINPTSFIPTINNNGPTCEGQDLKLFTNTVAESYAWTGPNGFTSTDQNPIIFGANTSDLGNYCLVVTTIGCTSSESCMDVIVNPIPNTPIANSNGPICEGEDLEFSANSIPNATYYWYGPNGFTSSDQNPIITNATATNSGSYCLEVIMDNCTSLEGCTEVNVKPTPATPVVSYNGPICENDDLELSTNAVVDGTFAWSGPNGYISTNQNPTIIGADQSVTGSYCLIVTVDGCESEESCTDVFINPRPATPIVNSNSPICFGEDLELTTDEVIGASYRWESPTSIILGVEQNTIIPNGPNLISGVYTLTVIVNGCESDPGTTVVEIISIDDELTISNNSPVCIGEMVELSVEEVEGASYFWTGPLGATFAGPSVSFAAEEYPAGIYEVTMSLDGCFKTNTTQVIYTEAEIFTVEDNMLCVGESTSIFPISGGTYTLSNNDTGVVSGGSFVAFESGTTQLTYTSDMLGCPSEPVTITVLNCIEAESSCDDIKAEDIICDYNDLVNIQGTLSAQNSDGNQPSGELCDDGDEAQNIAWLGFVALEGDYELVVNTTNCTQPNIGEIGVQVGVYSECNFSEQTKIFCDFSSQEENEIRIPSSILTPGQTYFMYIDGFEGAICDYSIDVDGFYDNTYCTDLSKVTGVAYIDENENGTYEEGETLLRNALISLVPGNMSVLTNNEGKYIINTPKGEATLTAKMYEGYWINNELTIADLTVFETCVEGINFGFVPNLFYQEAKISVANSVTRCDWETQFYFTVENTGTIDIDARFEFDFDSKASYFATNLIGLQVNGDVASGDLGIIKPFEVKEYWIKLKMPQGSSALPVLDFKTTLYNSGDVEMDSYEQSEQLRCSYDPNDKREYPNRIGEENLTLMDEELEYTIRFQNNGNDTAFLVKIVDPLDPNIEPTSIRVINSSHSVETCIENENLIFIFEDIYLVDSMTNYDGSQGFVSFRCNTKEGRAENTIVNNTADIIFDTNAPIVTNTTINTLVTELCTNVTTELDIEICEGDNYNGYDESGIYTEFFPLTFGCDSMVIINLEVQGITYSAQDIEICEGEAFEVNGNEYILYESQEIADTMENGLGCITNIFIFDVQVNPNEHITIDTTICEGLEYQGLTESGVYTYDSFDVVTGCDIITTINLEVLPMNDPSCLVGTNDLTSSEVKIYPIPARGEFYLEGDIVIDAVSIYTMDYQKLKEISIENNGKKVQISTDGINVGIYIVAVRSENMIIYKKLIVE